MLLIHRETLWTFTHGETGRSSRKTVFRKMLKAIYTQTLRVITKGKNPTYPKAIKELKAAKKPPENVKMR